MLEALGQNDPTCRLQLRDVTNFIIFEKFQVMHNCYYLANRLRDYLWDQGVRWLKVNISRDVSTTPDRILRFSARAKSSEPKDKVFALVNLSAQASIAKRPFHIISSLPWQVVFILLSTGYLWKMCTLSTPWIFWLATPVYFACHSTFCLNLGFADIEAFPISNHGCQIGAIRLKRGPSLSIVGNQLITERVVSQVMVGTSPSLRNVRNYELLMLRSDGN